MRQRRAWLLGFGLLWYAAFACAQEAFFSVGEVQIESTADEPLRARYLLLEGAGGDKDAILWSRLLNEFQYSMHGMALPRHPLDDLKVVVSGKDAGAHWLTVTSGSPVPASDMTLLVELRRGQRSQVLVLDVPVGRLPASTMATSHAQDALAEEAAYSAPVAPSSRLSEILRIAGTMVGLSVFLLWLHLYMARRQAVTERHALAFESSIQVDSNPSPAMPSETRAISEQERRVGEDLVLGSSAEGDSANDLAIGEAAADRHELNGSVLLELESSEAAEPRHVNAALSSGAPSSPELSPEAEFCGALKTEESWSQAPDGNDRLDEEQHDKPLAAQAVTDELFSIESELPQIDADASPVAVPAAADEVALSEVSAQAEPGDPGAEVWPALAELLDLDAVAEVYKSSGAYGKDLSMLVKRTCAGDDTEPNPRLRPTESDLALEQIKSLYENLDAESDLLNRTFGHVPTSKPLSGLSDSFSRKLVAEKPDLPPLTDEAQLRLAEAAVLAQRAGDAELVDWLLGQLARQAELRKAVGGSLLGTSQA